MSKSIRKQVLEDLRTALATGVIRLYFLLWDYKNDIRHKLKMGSLWVLSLSTILLLVEAVLEWKGNELLQSLLHSSAIPASHASGAAPPVNSLQFWLYSPVTTAVRTTLLVLFIIGLAYLVAHHRHESKKPSYEYKFVQQLSQFIQGRQKNSSVHDVITSALPVFYPVFARAKINRCSVYWAKGDQLEVPPPYMFPPLEGRSYTFVLQKGVGTAGAVYEDMSARYVPRLFLPLAQRRTKLSRLLFSHAIKFESQEEHGISTLKGVEVDYFAFQEVDQGEPQFRSFVSVPVKSVPTGSCFGILNFDFDGDDPLDRSDIAMAVTLGVILGDEIQRLESATGS